MVIYQENFLNCTDEKQAYSIEAEKTHKYSTYDGEVKNQKLQLRRNGSKQLLIMPEVGEASFCTKISYNPSEQGWGKREIAWGICFGYDRDTRCGYQLILAYTHEDKVLKATLCKREGFLREDLETKIVSGVEMLPEREYEVSMSWTKNELELVILGSTLRFPIEPTYGVIALTREGGIREVCFSDLSVSAEKTEKKIFWEQSFSIPTTDGGSYPYDLKLTIFQYTNEKPVYEIAYELTGGVYENDFECKSFDCWTHDDDCFWGFYFALGTAKFYIHKGQLIFVDRDFPALTNVLDGKEIPYCGNFFVSCQPEFEHVFIGYDKRYSLNCGNQAAERMFAYEKDGTLAWIGKPLKEQCLIEIHSGKEKEITKRITPDFVDYEDALYHAQTNHYFLNQEKPEFWVDVYAKSERDYLTFSAELENTWLEKITDVEFADVSDENNILENYGYHKYRFHVALNPMEQGVYHLKFTCQDGESKVYTHTSAFEILDDEKQESPQTTAGLPDIYCGDGCAAIHATIDPAFLQPDMSIMHYVNGCLQNPIYSEKRRFWELTGLYKKQLYIWMTFRCLNSREETYKDFPGTVAHTDYLNYIYPGIEHSGNYYRYDLWAPLLFDEERVQNIYQSFLEEHAEYQNVFPKIDEKLLSEIQPWGGKPEWFFEQWGKIPAEAFEAWVQYINAKSEPLFLEQWDEIQKLNPNMKRFSYGPYNAYILNHGGAYDTKWYGFTNSGLEKVFDGGFLQFEDYPFACGYQPHKCAWNMATIKLEWKDLRIAPELYDSFREGCPDGAVAYANPPLGGKFMHPYQTITQLYEYLYYTAVLDADGFRFWDDNIIQMYELISFEPENRYHTLLKAWKIFRDHKPAKPLGKIAYVADFRYQDDRRTADISAVSLYNMCQAAMEIVHEVNSECGNPDGFLLKLDTILQLQEGELDVLVLPSLDGASDAVKEKIRALYRAGCALIATGSVSGLEDIFGVRSDWRKNRVNRLSYGEETEVIYPYNAEFFYSADGAEEYLSSDGACVMYRKNRALLINAPLLEVGVDSFREFSLAERANISTLVRTALGDFIHENSSFAICADEKCGVNLVKTEQGETLLLLADYSAFENEEPREVHVWLGQQKFKSLENLSYDAHDPELNLFQKDGYTDGFSVKIRPHEIMIFKAE